LAYFSTSIIASRLGPANPRAIAWNGAGGCVIVSHDRHFLAALSNRVLELTPEGVHQYGGGYTEYVARTGHEAPGLRS
jgi:hypothetical protein